MRVRVCLRARTCVCNVMQCVLLKLSVFCPNGVRSFHKMFEIAPGNEKTPLTPLKEIWRLHLLIAQSHCIQPRSHYFLHNDGTCSGTASLPAVKFSFWQLCFTQVLILGYTRV